MAKRVPPPEAAQLLAEGWVYVDVRSIPEFEAGHPAGARNVPLNHMTGGRMMPNADFRRVMTAAFAKDDKLVIGCKSGARSAQAAAVLEADGFTNIVDMRGGFAGERDPFGRVAVEGWAAANLPVETVAASGASYADLAKKAAP